MSDKISGTGAALSDADLLDYAAGQLPAGAMAAMAARLANDLTAQATLTEWRRQDAAIEALYQPVAREPVPDRLSDVIRRAEIEDSTDASGRPEARFWLVAAMIAALAVGTGAGWFARDLTTPGPASQTFAVNALRAYDTFVVEVAHPVEVAATDADHLNAWMSKRLGHEIRPPDFASAGFTLMGGRIVPSDQGAALCTCAITPRVNASRFTLRPKGPAVRPLSSLLKGAAPKASF